MHPIFQIASEEETGVCQLHVGFIDEYCYTKSMFHAKTSVGGHIMYDAFYTANLPHWYRHGKV